jgi:hypothetical protein
MTYRDTILSVLKNSSIDSSMSLREVIQRSGQCPSKATYFIDAMKKLIREDVVKRKHHDNAQTKFLDHTYYLSRA